MSEKIPLVKKEIDDVKLGMVKNVELLIERGEKLESIEDKTRELNELSTNFNRTGQSLKCQMFREKMCALFAILLLILICLAVTTFFIYVISKHF